MSQREGRGMERARLWALGLLLALAATGCQVTISSSPQPEPSSHTTAREQGGSPSATTPTLPATFTATVAEPSGARSSEPSATPSPAATLPQPTSEPTVALPAAGLSAAASVVTDTVALLPTPTMPALSVPARIVPARIEAPAIGLDAPVKPVGWSAGADGVSMWEVPDDASGWHINSALPGDGGNVVLSGHHNLGSEVFRRLVELQVGDIVSLHSEATSYSYRVVERLILPERDVPPAQRQQNAQWIMPTVQERLTLVTCWPYTDNSHRVVVVAEPVEGQAAAAVVNQ